MSEPAPRGNLTADEIWRIQDDLSVLRYRGIPIGPTLNDFLLIHYLWGSADSHRRTAWLNRARFLRHWLMPVHAGRLPPAVEPGRLLVTWQDATTRFDQMMLPIVHALGPDTCQILSAARKVPEHLPVDVPILHWNEGMVLKPKLWRTEYGRSCAEWHRHLHELCRTYDLPDGAFALLALRLLVASQWIDGSLELLERVRPPMVLTEYDRNHMWSCLVLAARHLDIPTVTLVHGVVPPDALGFAPVLADRIICWGESDRRKLAAAGESPDRILVGGCPRLTRELPLDRVAARRRLLLDPDRPTVLLATSPDRDHVQLAETFCIGLEQVPGAMGVVRLHPAETLEDYATVIERHPDVRFVLSSTGTLEDSLAAAEVVVVRGSGVGGDALMKRRRVVVLSPGGELHGMDAELVHEAGCPLTTTADELRKTLCLLLQDDPAGRPDRDRAERYLADFCDAFGTESAQRIAHLVEAELHGRADPGGSS